MLAMHVTPTEDEKPTSKQRILHLLKLRGDLTTTVLAEALNVSPMAVRQHLQGLKADGLVTCVSVRQPLGRPVKLWRLSQAATKGFPDRHADLMVDLLSSVEAVFGAAGVEALLADRSSRQIKTYCDRLLPSGSTAHWQDQVSAIAQLRNQEGYMAEAIEQPDGTMLLVENHCPICVAATACQGLCKAEIGVFQAVLGTAMTVERVEHLLQGDRRCAYRVAPVGSKR
jgi:predicted ArsR family transcriptional regulator